MQKVPQDLEIRELNMHLQRVKIVSVKRLQEIQDYMQLALMIDADSRLARIRVKASSRRRAVYAAPSIIEHHVAASHLPHTAISAAYDVAIESQGHRKY